MSEQQIAVELGEGFAGDDVDVVVDGVAVWHGSGVTTNYSVGIADVVRVAVPDAQATVEVQVRGASSVATVDTAGAVGEVRLRARVDPAGAVSLAPADDGPVF